MTYKNPLEFAASLTADFVEAAIPATSSCLDVGCGDGLVAAELINRGHQILAIDNNVEAVEKAKANGVNVIQSSLNDFQHEPFDRIILSRALHHMPPLVETLNRLDNLLAPKGHLIIEDFGFELADWKACGWVFKKTHLLNEEAGAKAPITHNPRHAWLANAGKVDAEEAKKIWLQHHKTKHRLLTSKKMREELAKKFSVESAFLTSYLFRYICNFLPATAAGAEQAHEVWQEETTMIAAGRLPALDLE